MNKTPDHYKISKHLDEMSVFSKKNIRFQEHESSSFAWFYKFSGKLAFYASLLWSAWLFWKWVGNHNSISSEQISLTSFLLAVAFVNLLASFLIDKVSETAHYSKLTAQFNDEIRNLLHHIVESKKS